jgi:N-acyl-D-aspartate/D-glutamate deacylase
MEPRLNVEGAVTLDACGRAVTPGFIDIHRHCDAAAFCAPDFGEIELSQGITTTVVGNCGMAPVPCNPARRDEAYAYIEPVVGPIPGGLPFGDYPSYTRGLEKLGLPINLGFLAGAGAIKTAVKGFSKTPFTPGELAGAVNYIRQAMESGALGLSFGLMYQGECYSSPAELTALARTAAEYGGTLCTHIRGEGDSLVNSVREVIGVAGDAGIRLNISHFKATGIKNWGKGIYQAAECVEAARKRGQNVAADFYPYDGGATTVQSLLPPSLREDTAAETREKLAGPSGKEFLRREIYRDHPGWDNMAVGIGWDRVIVSSLALPEHGAYPGRSMESIAREEGYADPADLLCDLLVSEGGRVGIIVLSMAQDDIDYVCRLPWTAVISDALYGGGSPHPRLYGAFPRIIREYVRERTLLTMEQAVHKMTAMPAERVGISGRGTLRPGCFADVLIFDPQNFMDCADYLHPRRKAVGMDTVVVNGTIAWRNGALCAKAGRPVYRAV